MRVRHSKTTTTKAGAMAAAAVMLGGAGSFALFGGTAEAVPGPQARCAFGPQTITAADGWRPLGLGVTINNGTVSRRVIAQLAADVGVDTLAEVRVGYSVDGGAVKEKVYGPGNLAQPHGVLADPQHHRGHPARSGVPHGHAVLAHQRC